MFRAIFAKVKAEANSFWGKYLARVFVAVPFLVALAFATVATTMMLVEQFGQLNAYLILAASFTLVG